MWTTIGTLGILAIEASYVPQILRLHRLKHAEALSLLYPALNVTGRALALAYAMHTGDATFIAGFIVGIALRLILLTQVVVYRWRPGGLEAARRGRAVDDEHALDGLAAVATRAVSGSAS